MKFIYVAFDSNPDGLIFSESAYARWLEIAPIAARRAHVAHEIKPAYAHHFGFVDVDSHGNLISLENIA